MEAPKFILERYIPGIINLIANRLVTTGIDTLSSFEVGLMDVRVMTHIRAKPNISASAIVDATGLNKGAVSRVLKSLLARGLVAAAAPVDPRRPVYALTKEGKAVTRSTDELGMKRHHLLVDGFTDEEVETLTALLQRVSANTHKLKAFADARKAKAR